MIAARFSSNSDIAATKTATADKPSSDCRVIDSAELFGDAREVVIEHGGMSYRLKITRFNKLILNK